MCTCFSFCTRSGLHPTGSTALSVIHRGRVGAFQNQRVVSLCPLSCASAAVLWHSWSTGHLHLERAAGPSRRVCGSSHSATVGLLWQMQWPGPPAAAMAARCSNSIRILHASQQAGAATHWTGCLPSSELHGPCSSGHSASNSWRTACGIEAAAGAQCDFCCHAMPCQPLQTCPPAGQPAAATEQRWRQLR